MYFSTRFDQLGIRDDEALPITMSLGNIECKDFKALALLATVREDIHNHALQVGATEIPRRVEAAQAEKLVPVAIPTSGAVEYPSPLTGQKRASKGHEGDGKLKSW